MSDNRYGNFYWKVTTKKADEIWLYAETMQIQSGCLMAIGKDNKINFAFADGEWVSVYAASCMDGGAVAVEHWDSANDHASASRVKRSVTPQ